MQLLLLSNSTHAGQPFLSFAAPPVSAFLSARGVTEVLFIPYAGVSISWDDYHREVMEKFRTASITVLPIQHQPDPVAAVMAAPAVMVGGGNTFHLLKHMQEQHLSEAIRTRAMGGMPYIGWSAGANMACPTICTTNDMPIVQPASFAALNLVPFQINPHYMDTHPAGHAGETREQRLLEYTMANPGRYVAGLREGSLFRVNEGHLSAEGRSIRIFRHGQSPREAEPGEDLSFLMQDA